MRRRGRYFAILLGLTIAALACNALNGAGDLTFDRCESCNEADAPSDALADVVREDTASDASPDAVTRPSYCDGIVMYVRFDGTLTTTQGVGPDMPPPTAFATGKYGSAAVLAPDGGALYYPQGDGGTDYPRAEGTMAIWFKAQWTWPSALDRVFYRAVAERVANTPAGPFMKADVLPSFVGSANTNPDGGGVTTTGTTAAELTGYWKDGTFNHLVQTWSQSAPTLTFTLNGAEGDAAVTRHETDAAWAPQSPTVAFIRLSSNASFSDGQFDDVVMWSRALSLAEIQAVYGASKAVGDICGL